MKVAPQMRHELGVGRVIRRFDAHDPRLEGAVVLVQVSKETELRLGGAHEKNLTVPLQGARDLAKVPVLVVGVIPDAKVDLIGVTVNVRAG